MRKFLTLQPPMKSALLTVIAVLSLSLAGHAEQTNNKIVSLDQNGTEAIAAMLMAKPADLLKFTKSGNTVDLATLEQLDPTVTEYVFERKMCNHGGINGVIYLGGSRLTVTVQYIKHGEVVNVIATSKVVLFRDK